MFALLKLVDKEREGDKRLDNGRREGLPHGRVVRRGGRNERLGPGGLPSDRVNPILSYTAGGPVGLTAHSVASFVKEELGGESVAVGNLPWGPWGQSVRTGCLVRAR